MTKLREYTYLLELFDTTGKQVKMTSDLLKKKNKSINFYDPMYYAVFPVSSVIFKKKFDLAYYKVIRTQMDDSFKKMENSSDEIVMCFFDSQNIASEVASDLALETFYWFDEDMEWPLSTTEDIFGNPVEDDF